MSIKDCEDLEKIIETKFSYYDFKNKQLNDFYISKIKKK